MTPTKNTRNVLGGLFLVASLGLAGVACEGKRDKVVSEKAVESADEAADRAKAAVKTDDMDKARSEMKEAGREIGSANEKLAEEKKDVARAQEEVNKEVAEGRREVGDAFAKTRDDVRNVSAKNADFATAKERVILDIERHVAMRRQEELALPSRMTTSTNELVRKKVNDLDADYREAQAGISRLRKATAANWDSLRDEALDAVVDYDQKVIDAKKSFE